MSLLTLLTSLAMAGGDGSVGVLVGTGAAFDGDPASLRLSVRGEVGPTEGEVVGLSFALPATIATRGSDGFGFSTRSMLVELPPSLRVRLLPQEVISLYGDVGAGLAIGSSEVETFFGDASTSSTSFMTRAAVGLELGDPDGLAFVLEPASLSTYHADDRAQATYGLMLGLTAHI